MNAGVELYLFNHCIASCGFTSSLLIKCICDSCGCLVTNGLSFVQCMDFVTAKFPCDFDGVMVLNVWFLFS